MALVKLNNNGVKNATAFGSITGLGSMTFIKKLTASSSSTLTFHHGTDGVVLDSTYKEYLFTFKDIRGNHEDGRFQFQTNAVGASGFNETITSTYFKAQHNQSGSYSVLAYVTGYDQAQGTAFQNMSDASGKSSTAERTHAGTITLYNPSSTTFVKHFISNFSDALSDDYMTESFVSGYINTTSAIDEVRFQMSTSTFNGDICLYGIA